ncbi:putative polyprotein [Myrmica rubra picorna-like virus 5]|nr:putative polyprotein [Myrmica rubra picorna-like virus 5]
MLNLFKSFTNKDNDKIIDLSSHLEIIQNLNSRLEVHNYIYKENLFHLVKMPSCTFDELKNNKNHLLDWVFETFNDKFLAMWFGVEVYKLVHLRRANIQLINQDFSNMGKETYKMVKEFLFRAFGILTSYVSHKVSGEKFKASSFMGGIATGKDIASFTGDFFDSVTKNFFKHDDPLLDTISKYQKDFDEFNATPTHQFMRNNRKIYDISDKLNACSEFIRSVPRDRQHELFPLQGLYNSVCQRRNDILQNAIPEFKRQEPFCVLVTGKGGIGKTRLIQDYLSIETLKFMDNATSAHDYIEIRADDKYWPPLSGQRVAFFDEAGTYQNIENDLLFRNMQSICSSAYFNCPTAALTHKVTPCPFQVVYATTNTDLYTLQGRVSSGMSANSVYPFWRRCLAIEVEWNADLMGEFNYREPTGHRSDMKHLRIKLMEWDQNQGRMVFSKNLSREELLEMIKQRYRKMEAEHVRFLNMQGLVKQVDQRIHYSCHLRGPPSAGKTPQLEQISKQLSINFKYPIINFEEFNQLKQTYDFRIIAVFDDIFHSRNTAEELDLFMKFYNLRCADGSIFLFASNLPNNYSRIPKVSQLTLAIDRRHPYDLPGITRRIGLRGNFNGEVMPSYNDEIFFNNEQGTEPIVYTIPTMEVVIPLSILLFGMLMSYSFIPNYYFIPHFINIIELFITCYVIKKRNKLFTKTLPKNLNEYVYNRYMAFIKSRDDFVVREGEIPDSDFSYQLEADSIKSVDFSKLDCSTLQKIYTNKLSFKNADTKPWKLYISDRLTTAFRDTYQQFEVNCSGFDYLACIEELKRLARIMRSSNINPNIRVFFKDVGEFSCVDNLINYKLINKINKTSNYSIAHTANSVLIYGRCPTINIPLDEIFAKTVNIATKYKLNYEQIREFVTYIESSEFVNNPMITKLRHNFYSQQCTRKQQQKFKELKDKLTNFFITPTGFFIRSLMEIIITLITTILIMKMVIKVINWFNTDNFKDKDMIIYDEDGNVVDEAKKNKPRKKIVKYDTDEDERQAPRKRPVKKVNPTWSDADNGKQMKQLLDEFLTRQGSIQRQDVKTLVDMNSYDAYKPYIDVAVTKARKNMTQLYFVHSQESKLYSEPIGEQACYGLFIRKNLLVTVGHVAKDIKRMPAYNLYVGCDSFNGVFYKAVCRNVFKARDLSAWTVEGIPDFPDISNLFVKKKEIYEMTEGVNTALQRFGPNKEEIWVQGSAEMISEYYQLDKDGIQEFGIVDFATFDLMLTNAGDCGLPYYPAERTRLHNRILGIHCMGNVTGYNSIGIMALIYLEDIQLWSQFCKQDVISCRHCGETNVMISPSLTPKCDTHEIAWSPVHESSPATFSEELNGYFKLRGNFTGQIIKNSGPRFYGSVEHSHTQFLHNVFRDNVKVTNGWRTSTAEDLDMHHGRIDAGETISYCVKDVPFPAIYNMFNAISFAKNFRLNIDVFINKENKRRAIISLFVPADEAQKKQIIEYGPLLNFNRQGNIPLPISETEEVYVSGDISDIANQYIARKRRGFLPDIPFEKIENNNTVSVIGIAHRNMSPQPNAVYKVTPFINRLQNIQPYKVPVRFDSNNAPQEVRDTLALDRAGFPSARITAALKWAHPIISPPIDLRKYVLNQFRSNILEYYANLNLLTDKQVLSGYENKHRLRNGLQGMELDSSIGFTMKQLYTVQKKSDVIDLSATGEYSWADNEASEFLQEMYHDSKQLVSQGKRPWIAFNELLKMEKLKPEKQFLPRTFTAQDLLGVLLERWVLGEFTARAMLWDKNCGVGINPYTEFDKLFRYLSQHPNVFTGDYKNFDRLIPVSVFDDIRDLLIEANPHIKNEITSTFNSISKRIQISGTALTCTIGGMPSGCVVTAPLNCKLNHIMIFTAYISICWKNDRNELATYARFVKLVHIVFYGDDVIVTVSNEIKNFFNLVSLSLELKTLFGMIMTSSDKSGELKYFESWNEASWISRYFRKLDNYPFYVGALKKISINSHFCYVSSLKPEHLGALFTVAQWEAALWEDEYFNNIQENIRIAIRYKPNIGLYFNFRSRLDIQSEIFNGSVMNKVITHGIDLSEINKIKATSEEDDWNAICAQDTQNETSNTTLDKYYQIRNITSDYSKFLVFLGKLPEKVSLEEKYMNKRSSKYFIKMSIYSKLNEMFQRGEVTKPELTFMRFLEEWECEISCKDIGKDRQYNVSGQGNCKAVAREQAAAGIVELYNSARISDPNTSVRFMRQMLLKTKFERQMNVSKGVEHAVPGARMVSTDPSISPDTGIATNVDTVSPVRVINPGAIALDNPAGSGAAFDKRDSIYRVYHRWSEKNSTINGSLTQGAEVLRISLDPRSLPKRIREYIDFHNAIIPQIDVQILIGGAAGSIGWLKFGWIPNDAMKVTLDDLQLVAAEEVNLNNTLTMCTMLNDNRRSGLYRLVKDDPEPWPALVLMVDHPALNVQRNDDVNYPIFVNVRLGPNCLLMQPYNTITNIIDGTTRIALSGILQGQSIDLLIGTPNPCNRPTSTKAYPDCGWYTGQFQPEFTRDNLCSVGMSWTSGVIVTREAAYEVKYPLTIKGTGTGERYYRPYSFVFAYGEVDASICERYTYRGEDPPPTGTTYTIPKFTIKFGSMRLSCTQVNAFENGIVMVFRCDNVQRIHCQIESNGDITMLGDAQDITDYVFLYTVDKAEQFVNPLDFTSATPSYWWSITPTNTPISHNNQNLMPRTRPKDFYFAVPYPGVKDNRFFQFTYIQSGNNVPTTSLPAGIRFAAMCRPGTSSNISNESGFYPLLAPGIAGVFGNLDLIAHSLKADIIQMDVLVDGRLFTKVAYADGTFLVRTNVSRRIRTALSTNIILDNIQPIDNINTLPPVPINGFEPWTTGAASLSDRFMNMKFMRQSAALIGASAAGGLFSGLTSALQFGEYNQWRNNYLQKQIDAQRSLAMMNNQNQRDLSKQNFDQRMELLGRSSSSALSGNVASSLPPPSYTTNSLPSKYSDNASNSSVSNASTTSYVQPRDIEANHYEQINYPEHIYEELNYPTDSDKGYDKIQNSYLRNPAPQKIYNSGKTDPNILEKDSRSFANLLDDSPGNSVYDKTNPLVLGDNKPSTSGKFNQLNSAMAAHPAGWGAVAGQLEKGFNTVA